MSVVSEVITLEVQTACDNPVQLRWKNRLGGWNYYVFSLRQFKDIDTDGATLFQENYKYIENVRTVLDFYRKEGRPVWDLFAENIVGGWVELLQELSISPRVELYLGEIGSPAAHTYETVIVNSVTAPLDTYKNRHNVSVQIRLLELNTLRNL